MYWKMGLRCSKISIFILVRYLFASDGVCFVSFNTIVGFEVGQHCQKIFKRENVKQKIHQLQVRRDLKSWLDLQTSVF
jgi:hypothetical protein